MSILEMVFIGGVVLTLLSVLSLSFNSIQFIRYNKQLKALPIKKSKNKKRNKQVKNRRRHLLKKKKGSLKGIVVFLLLSVIIGLSSVYVSYYQSMNLSTEDSNSVVKGYYLLRDFETQVKLAKEQGESEKKIQQNLRYLATSLASYGIKSASELNAKEGQLVLNRYYNALKEIGTNASTNTGNFYGNSKLEEEFLTDIGKVKRYEESVFDFYKVNAEAFKEEK
ncbi:hypothetical protein [Enterococcus rivorum]|uniref:Uncharacterized protein n=1 Tax=Enterococcus rivorum TaxID=762845 RepID=A0A1E5KYB4_9ENTE|nr:hypothetical protein [Enterococcus rivorum]MBP2099966.1 hypothetical protein [Enterococcus rivorum]OEH82823.1 hypothetical protein BCR26_11385 [Enterococcus rivorum]